MWSKGLLISFFPVCVLRNRGKMEEINIFSKILPISSLCLGAGKIRLDQFADLQH